jgi:hypothetical protein
MKNEETVTWVKVKPGIPAEAKQCECDSRSTPLLLCLLLAAGAAFCDSISDHLLNWRDSGDRVAGWVVKTIGKVVDTAKSEVC